MQATTVTIEPNELYDRVFNQHELGAIDRICAAERYSEEHPVFECASGLSSQIDAITRRSPQAFAFEAVDLLETDQPVFSFPNLSWDDIDVPKDPGILNRMADYFDGISRTDSPSLIRAKLRLVPATYVVNTQIAATTPEYPNTETEYECSHCGHTGRFVPPESARSDGDDPDAFITECKTGECDGKRTSHYRTDLDSNAMVETVGVNA